MAALFIAISDIRPEMFRRAVDVLVQAHHGVRGEIIQQRAGAREEQRQVVFDAGRRVALAHLGIDQAALRVALDVRAIGLAELLDARLADREFARRQQANLGHALDRALCFRVEGAQRFHLVIE